jgi:hypothetical protein
VTQRLIGIHRPHPRSANATLPGRTSRRLLACSVFVAIGASRELRSRTGSGATYRVAYGAGFPFVFGGDPDERLHAADSHVDFMVGRPELEVDALLADVSAPCS